MIVLVALVLVAVSVPCAGGRLADLAQVNLRWPWLVVGGFALQFFAISVVPTMPTRLAESLHVASYVIAAAFVALNRHVRWLWLVAVGGGLNALAIAANGGVMPASTWAFRTAGLTTTGSEFANSRPFEHPRLLFLGDVFAVPARWPLANVFSAGDVVLVVGSAMLLHAACRSRPQPADAPGAVRSALQR